MVEPVRQINLDVSGEVDVTDPDAVVPVLRAILDARYKDFDFSVVNTLVSDFSRLYQGQFPGFRGCDISYHNIQHVLDVTLAMTRLMDGHEQSSPSQGCLGPELALAGVASALFHDSGYIRRTRDTRHTNGAAYTRTHVSRGARFLADYLPQVGLGSLVPVCGRIVHFTGYELDPDKIEVSGPVERRLGEMLGTADLIAQIADADYIRKCHDDLFREFEVGGIAGSGAIYPPGGKVYVTAGQLLADTPEFIQKTIDLRLNGFFNQAYRYAETYFGGRNLYIEAIEENRDRLIEALAAGGVELPAAR
jgi:hypothetical protein